MFELEQNKTNVKTEFIAALTTFFTLSYIFVINPRFLADAGMDYGAVFVATAISGGIATLLMGVLLNRPFALVAGMGLNSYFSYSIVRTMGFRWEAALAAVFASNILILIIVLLRINFSKAIPESFKHALIAGLGLFLVFIGMQNAHFVVMNPNTFVSIGDLTQPAALIAVFGFFVTSALVVKNVKGGMFLGVVATTLVAMLAGFAPLPAGIFEMPPDVSSVAFRMDLQALSDPALFPVVWSLFIIVLLDLVGSITALSVKAGKSMEGLDKAIGVNAVGGAIGAGLGTSPMITYLESASGIEAGGRTGLTAVFIALFFFISIFFFPVISAIPIEAAAPVMIIVGEMMLLQIRFIDLKDHTEAIPALMTVATIPFTFSISNGIGVGSIAYIFLKLVSKKPQEIHPAMYLIALLSILAFANVL
ncbi:MAG: NCS2 family permease [Candidatus ainarchaeum sp.]|nr:NCS2 family permease [Candidatus ainarchaeum sp.]MDD5095976.1 NCS2 family permease [Candidatus ainarchaeum sp.]